MVFLNLRFLSCFKRGVFLSLFFSFCCWAVSSNSKQQTAKTEKKAAQPFKGSDTFLFIPTAEVKNKRDKVTGSIVSATESKENNKITTSFILTARSKNQKKRDKITAPFMLTTGNKEEKEKVTYPFIPAIKFRVGKKEEQKARGLVIRYYKWPSLKRQKEIVGILKSSGLKRTKSIKSFKAQLFSWTKGGLKPSALGEKACLKLKSLSYVKRCSPDHLLPRNQSKTSSQKPVSKTKASKNNKLGYMLERALASSNIKKVNKREKANKRKKADKREIQNKLPADKKTEAGFVVECEDCKKKDVKALNSAVQKALNLRTCNIVSHKRNLQKGKLSDYWAQELIGSDLMKEELQKTAPPDIENWIAVFDTKVEDHSIAVKNLISDEGPHAVLPELKERKTSFLEVENKYSDRDYRKGKGYKSALNLYETSYPGDYLFGVKGNPPRYINNSMGWRNSKDIYDVFKKLSSSKTSQPIVVVASGNDFPTGVEYEQEKASKNFDVILVGSLAPTGVVSDFSQSNLEVSILAPSDYQITSTGKYGEYKKFGGTSGAAPLVTGSLAGFEWLSGYHPTAKEAKILLEKTALPTLHSFEKPPVNGAGLLNAYKLGETAKRLKKKCKGKSVSCFKKEILKDENYRFTKDKSLRRNLKRVFPSCSGSHPEESSVSSCEEKKELFTRLRKEILLNPTREYYRSLSCLYKTAGFFANAKALNRLSWALGTESESRAEMKAMLAKKKSVPKYLLRLAIAMGGFEKDFNYNELLKGMKIAGGIGETGLPLLERGFKTGNPKLQKTAVFSAGQIGEAGLPLLEQALKTGNPKLQKTAVFSAGRIGEAGLPLLERGFKTGNPEIQKEALSAAGRIGEAGLPLLERGFKTGNPEIQKEAVSSAGIWIGEPALPLLERGFETGNPEIQKTAVFSAGRIGEAGLPLLERGFETGNPEIQKTAVSSAGRIGEAGLPLLERGFETGNPELQTEALNTAEWIGEPALPLLKKMLKDPNLDEYIKKEIKGIVERL